jgi:hypothetical protein
MMPIIYSQAIPEEKNQVKKNTEPNANKIYHGSRSQGQSKDPIE